MIQCPDLKMPVTHPECGLTGPLPTIKKLLVRKTKEGKIQVKINGKGKWTHAELKGNVLSFLA